MKRQLSDWLTAYEKFTENSESPSAYHTWAGVSVIAGTLQRRCWMPWGHSVIYPNQYIILIGPSGARKGEPLVIARNFMREVGVALIPEAITRQALYRFVSSNAKPFTYGNQMRLQCAVSGVFEEVSVFLGEGDARFLASLTNWYDSREMWTYETKNAGVDEIHGICFNMLGSTAPDWIPLIIPYTAIGGGFTSRIIFIVEHQKQKIIEDPNILQIDRSLERALLHDLELIYQITGEFSFDADTLGLYKEWYRTQEERAMEGKLPIQDPRFHGYLSRRATHVKKIAMALSASQDGNRIIRQGHFETALRMMLRAEERMPNVFAAVGRSQFSEQTDAVMRIIQERGAVRRSDLMRLLYYDLDIKTMDIVRENLVAMRVIKVRVETAPPDEVYEWADHAAEQAPAQLQ